MSPESLAHEPWDQLAVGQAFDALEPEDEAALFVHLPTCQRCRQLLEETRGVVTELAYAAEPADPPPALWQGIRDAVAASDRPALAAAPSSSPPPQPHPISPTRTARPGAPVVPSAATSGAAARGGASDASGPTRGRRLTDLNVARAARSNRSTGRPVWQRWAAAAGAAAALVGAVALGRFVVPVGHGNGAPRELAAVQSCLGTAGCHAVALHPAGTSGTAAVALVRGNRVRLLVDDIAPNDRARQIYVLWQQDANGTFKAVGTFDVTKEGRQIVDAGRLPDPYTNTAALAITREPGRTAPARPSTAPLIKGTVA